ncbi:MAG TPA: Ig-like domain-containing protein [Paenarthrobacter sp.]|nr:Ig-like domain-containing protein [Paenarthrobacter sp.]
MSKHLQAPRVSMGRWNRLIVVVLGILLVSWGGPAASAFWSSVSSNGAAAKADAVAQGAKPTTSVSGANVTVTWAASTTAAGRSVTGYSIARYASATGGTRIAATGACSGSLTALSCVESNAPAGTWYYTVTPLLSLWQGTESLRSVGTTPITDTTPPDAPKVTAPAVVNSANVASVPVSGTAEAGSSLALTVSGTGAQPIIQTVTVNGSGNWTAAALDLRAFTDGTINYSAKATDAAGNTSVAGTASSSKDSTAPTVSNVQLANGSGGVVGKIEKGDSLTITFSEALNASTLCSSWTSNTTNQTISGNGQVTVSVSAGDVLTVTSSVCTFNMGSVALGADYASTAMTFSGNGSNASSLVWNPTAKTLTVTLGGSSGSANTGPFAAAAATLTPVSVLTDIAGNPLATTPVAGTASRF